MTKDTKKNSRDLIAPAGYSLLCGALTGVTIFLFKIAAKKAEEISVRFYTLAGESVLFTFLLFAGLILLAFVMSYIHKASPECKGGGIPRSEGILRGTLPIRWFRTLLGTFLGSIVSFLVGVPVGTEGPAVLIGTSVGRFSTHFSRKSSAWSKYVMTGGAGAGFAVATGAPLSGILFTLEEVHKFFSPMLVLNVSLAVLAATGVNTILCQSFHMDPNLFSIGSLESFQLENIGYLLLLAVLITVGVALFDYSILAFRKFTAKGSMGKYPVKLLFLFLLTGILGLFFSDGIYSGHHLIVHILEGHTPVLLLIALFIVRMLMMLFVTDSGSTGGIFVPTLAIGAVAAALIDQLLLLLGMPEELSAAVILLGMCAFIGGTLRAPMTAAVLFLELTGQFTNLFYVALVIFIVAFFTELINQVPFYDKALEEMEEAEEAEEKKNAH